MNRKKKRLKLGKLILFIVSIVIITFGVIFGIKKIFGNSNIIIKKSYDKYLASENNVVSIYEYSKNEDGTEVLNKSEDITRGTKISTKNDKFTYEEKEYTLINYNDKEYYVLTNELVDNNRDVVLEKSRFVRTSVTVYKNEVDWSVLMEGFTLPIENQVVFLQNMGRFLYYSKDLSVISMNHALYSQMEDSDWERIRNQLQEDIKNYYSEMGGI